jgi:hypothetical protein
VVSALPCVCLAMEDIRPSIEIDGRHSTIECQEHRILGLWKRWPSFDRMFTMRREVGERQAD